MGAVRKERAPAALMASGEPVKERASQPKKPVMAKTTTATARLMKAANAKTAQLSLVVLIKGSASKAPKLAPQASGERALARSKGPKKFVTARIIIAMAKPTKFAIAKMERLNPVVSVIKGFAPKALRPVLQGNGVPAKVR